MPQTWIKVPTGTPPWLEPFRDDPVGLKRFVEGVVGYVREAYGERDAQVVDVYIEVDEPIAYVLVRDLDDPITLKAVCRYLGAEGFTKLLRVEQAAEAVQRYDAIRNRPQDQL